MERNKKKENYSLNTKKGSYKNIKLTDIIDQIQQKQEVRNVIFSLEIVSNDL